jgi:DNA-binding response OmpR family regulator
MKKILVVDDDEDLLANMKKYLKRQGYEVAVTTSCDEGLQIFNSFKPDSVFLDINVGDQDGREMCLIIKTRAESRHVPVILISANHDDLKLYRDFGADSFVKKPFEFSRLIDTLNAYL